MESDKREGEVRMGVLSMFYIACHCRECGKRISPGLFKDNRTIFNLPRFLFTHTFSLTPTLFSFSLIDQSVLLLLSRPACSLSHEALWWDSPQTGRWPWTDLRCTLVHCSFPGLHWEKVAGGDLSASWPIRDNTQPSPYNYGLQSVANGEAKVNWSTAGIAALSAEENCANKWS